MAAVKREFLYFLAYLTLPVIPIFQSQMDFSLTSGSADQGISSSQADTKAAKAPHSTQIGKSTPATKVWLDLIYSVYLQ